MDEKKYNRVHVGSSTSLLSRRKSKPKHERDLFYSPLDQIKRYHCESMDISSEEEDDEDDIEFDDDNDEQCTPSVNLYQSVRGSSSLSFQPAGKQPSNTSPPPTTEKK